MYYQWQSLSSIPLIRDTLTTQQGFLLQKTCQITARNLWDYHLGAVPPTLSESYSRALCTLWCHCWSFQYPGRRAVELSGEKPWLEDADIQGVHRLHYGSWQFQLGTGDEPAILLSEMEEDTGNKEAVRALLTQFWPQGNPMWLHWTWAVASIHCYHQPNIQRSRISEDIPQLCIQQPPHQAKLASKHQQVVYFRKVPEIYKSWYLMIAFSWREDSTTKLWAWTGTRYK